jgi:CDP-diacylglycerol---glycerol-3-phosphate 3-phosphatidyltransferase
MNIANFFSFLRIFLAPLIGFFLYLGGYYFCPAIFCFTIAIITDYCDGYFARKYNYETSLGNFLDPLADKILVISILLVFYWISKVSLFFVLVIVLRDVLITLVRIFMAKRGSSLQTSSLGKYKTFFQFVFIYIILIKEIVLLLGFYPQYFWILESLSLVILYVVITLSIYSACNYCWLVCRAKR